MSPVTCLVFGLNLLAENREARPVHCELAFPALGVDTPQVVSSKCRPPYSCLRTEKPHWSGVARGAEFQKTVDQLGAKKYQSMTVRLQRDELTHRVIALQNRLFLHYPSHFLRSLGYPPPQTCHRPDIIQMPSKLSIVFYLAFSLP